MISFRPLWCNPNHDPGLSLSLSFSSVSYTVFDVCCLFLCCLSGSCCFLALLVMHEWFLFIHFSETLNYDPRGSLSLSLFCPTLAFMVCSSVPLFCLWCSCCFLALFVVNEWFPFIHFGETLNQNPRRARALSLVSHTIFNGQFVYTFVVFDALLFFSGFSCCVQAVPLSLTCCCCFSHGRKAWRIDD